MKLIELRPGLVAFFCPGCGHKHAVWVSPGDHPTWGYNGNPESPTFTPSLRVYVPAMLPGEDWPNGKPEETLCHSFVKDGQIQFLADCAHKLAGQTVLLPEWPEGAS